MSSRAFVWLWLAGFCAALATSGAPPLTTPEQHGYDDAKARYQTNIDNNTAALNFASACFDWADNAPGNSARAAVAGEGIQACRRWLERAPNQAAAHYYLGMNLAQLARAKSLGALPLLKEMEKEWLATISLDPHFDFAGADRNLGLLYRDAPGFPIGIGSRAKAAQHIQRAVKLNPEYPENHINLIETHLKHKPEAARAEYQTLLALLPAARKQFSGPHWQSAWKDWDARLQKIRVRLSHAP